MDTRTHSRITLDPDVCNGKPTVRGLRITVETVLGLLAAGEAGEEILGQYPMLEAEDIAACLEYASDLMGHRFSTMDLAAQTAGAK